MNSEWDVAIIGGGPAGSASAISLRQTFLSLRVLILESSDYSQTRAGEVLPPISRQLLVHLGVLSQMTEQVASPARGIACVWGDEHLREANYFHGLSGEGWHLERNRFDAMLALHAEALGADVRRNTSLQFFSRHNGLWQLRLSGNQNVSARFVIDASGRSAAFARGNETRCQTHDALMSFSRIFRHDKALEANMVVEACANGWWYTASLPGCRRVVSLLTDADIGRELHLSMEQPWQRELAATTHMRTLLEGATLLPGILVRSAATLSLNCVHGDGWLAVGDAASAYDPLSAQGITNALRLGIIAGFAAGDTLCHNQVSAAERYASIVRAQRASYHRAYRQHYSRERRWSDQLFWQRRQDKIATASSAMSISELFPTGAS